MTSVSSSNIFTSNKARFLLSFKAQNLVLPCFRGCTIRVFLLFIRVTIGNTSIIELSSIFISVSFPSVVIMQSSKACEPRVVIKKKNIAEMSFLVIDYYLPKILFVSTKFGLGIGVFGAVSYFNFCCLSI